MQDRDCTASFLSVSLFPTACRGPILSDVHLRDVVAATCRLNAHAGAAVEVRFMLE